MTPDLQIFAMLWSWLQRRDKEIASPSNKTGSMVRFPQEAPPIPEEKTKRKAA